VPDTVLKVKCLYRTTYPLRCFTLGRLPHCTPEIRKERMKSWLYHPGYQTSSFIFVIWSHKTEKGEEREGICKRKREMKKGRNLLSLSLLAKSLLASSKRKHQMKHRAAYNIVLVGRLFIGPAMTNVRT
jgi:hypothetical protein